MMVVMEIKAKMFDNAPRAVAAASLTCALIAGVCGAAYATGAAQTQGEGLDADLQTEEATQVDASQTDAPLADAGSQPEAAPDPESESVTVIGGKTQFDTSALQALEAFPEGCSTVVVASGINPIDALAATSLAGALDCPILLTSKTELPDSVAQAVAELGCSKAIVVGGEAVVAKSVESQLSAAMAASSGASVERLAGTSQYDTQLAIFEYGRQNGLWNGSDTVIAVSGRPASMADGLSISPVAYKLKAPVFLVDSKGNLAPEAISALAGDASFRQAVLVGGTAVVSDVTYGFFQGVTMCHDGSSDVVRLAGRTLYDTSAEVARWAVESGILTWTDAAFATGRAPYDALAGSALQGKSGSVMLLIDPGYTAALDAAVAAGADAVKHVRFFGGDAVMPESLRTVVTDRLGIEPSEPQTPVEPQVPVEPQAPAEPQAPVEHESPAEPGTGSQGGADEDAPSASKGSVATEVSADGEGGDA